MIPWTDLVYAAAPNGRVPINGVSGRAVTTKPVGVEKATVVNAIFAAAQFAVGPGQPIGEPFVPGRPMGYLAPSGTDSDGRRRRLGRPDQRRRALHRRQRAPTRSQTLTSFHSAYYVTPRRPPAPLFIASGFTDDLFPVDEALRYANRTRKLHPEVPLSLMFGDFGHQRASNDPLEREVLLEQAPRLHGQAPARDRPRAPSPASPPTCSAARSRSTPAAPSAPPASAASPTASCAPSVRGPFTVSSEGLGDPDGRPRDRPGQRWRRLLRDHLPLDLARHRPDPALHRQARHDDDRLAADPRPPRRQRRRRRARPRSPPGSGTSTPTAPPSTSSPAAPTGPGRARTSGSSTPAPGASAAATRPSSSCSAPTSPTAAPRTRPSATELRNVRVRTPVR